MSKKNSPASPVSTASGNRRAQLAAQTAQAERDRTIRRRIGFGLLAAAIAVIVFAGAWLGVSAFNSRPSDSATGGDTFTVGIGETTAPVRVDLYQDFMCPYCGVFEQVNGESLEQLVDDGTVRLEIHPMSFLDQASGGTQYSTRAANAFVTAAQAQPEQVLAFNSALYDNQPAEGSAGLSDEQIAGIAVAAGIDQDVADSFTAMEYERWVKDGTRKDFDDGITGTPTVLIEGEKFEGDFMTPGPLEDAIRAAADE